MKVVPLIEYGRWRIKRDNYITEWHPWFAWRPVKMAGNDWRWWEMIERKLEFVGGPDGVYTFVSYRAAQPANANRV